MERPCRMKVFVIRLHFIKLKQNDEILPVILLQLTCLCKNSSHIILKQRKCKCAQEIRQKALSKEGANVSVQLANVYLWNMGHTYKGSFEKK